MEKSKEYQSAWTNEGFNKRFEELLQDYDKYGCYERVYLACEEEHIAKFGKIRYASYDSFRSCRNKLIFKR